MPDKPNTLTISFNWKLNKEFKAVGDAPIRLKLLDSTGKEKLKLSCFNKNPNHHSPTAITLTFTEKDEIVKKAETKDIIELWGLPSQKMDEKGNKVYLLLSDVRMSV